MNVIKVTKCFELRGHDAKDLARRLDTLHQAVRARSGEVLDIKWSGTNPTGVQTASILYQIPLYAPAA